MISYDQPNPVSIEYHYASPLYTYPQPKLTVAGLNFGTSGRSPAVQVGFSSCWNSEWTAHTSLVCRYIPGTSDKLSVVLSVGLQVCTVSKLFHYKKPQLEYPSEYATSYQKPLGWSSPKTGTLLVLLFGNALGGNFGISTSGTAASSTIWTSDIYTSIGQKYIWIIFCVISCAYCWSSVRKYARTIFFAMLGLMLPL